jgi:hypothetical protein
MWHAEWVSVGQVADDMAMDQNDNTFFFYFFIFFPSLFFNFFIHSCKIQKLQNSKNRGKHEDLKIVVVSLNIIQAITQQTIIYQI